jgi:hypothetical protein
MHNSLTLAAADVTHHFLSFEDRSTILSILVPFYYGEERNSSIVVS